jgi:hypothetical protein
MANMASSMFSTNSSASTLKNISNTEADWMTQQNMVTKKSMPINIRKLDENIILPMLITSPVEDGTCSMPLPMISRAVGISCSFNTAIRIGIFVQEKEHELFKRNGANLLIVEEVSLNQALCGYSWKIKHLDGRVLVIKSNQMW